MITLGKFNSLKVSEELPMGLIAHSADSEEVFIPYQQTQYQIADSIEAFVYLNRDGQLEGTLEPPKIFLNEFASLPVLNVIKSGAFLDWGLKPDLFLPKRFMHNEVAENLAVVVKLVLDNKTEQLIADSKIEAHLHPMTPYWDKNKSADLLVYASTPLGFKCIIDQQFSGMLYHNELPTQLRVGQKISGFVKHVREDGKADLSLQQHNKQTRRDLETQILSDLQAHDGISSLTDKSPPEHIYQRFKVSKSAYKKALGALYKANKIVINKAFIKLV